MSSKHISGNRSLTQFDVIVIGSGAGGGPVAELLSRHGKKVLILEAGPNCYENLEDPDFSKVKTVFSNDEIKLRRRNFVMTDPLVEPRSFRKDERKVRTFIGDVNHLPKLVGGGSMLSDLKMPRFMPQDFNLGTLLGEIPGASFADWPVNYDQLERFYLYAERVMGIQGPDIPDHPYFPKRSAPYPMPPSLMMYMSKKISDGATSLGYQPMAYPSGSASRYYDGRPCCRECGFCCGYGCVISAKGTPAVTFVRKALMTGNCQLQSETRVTKLLYSSSKREIVGVEALDPQGQKVEFRADQYVLAASPIEDARLLFLSDLGGSGLGNSSGMVGRNLAFHYVTEVAGVFEERLHAQRGRVVSTGMLDFRGEAGNPSRPLGGMIEFGGTGEPINEALIYALRIGFKGDRLERYMKKSPLREHLGGMTMFGEDAPQLRNRVDLDPALKDLDGLPVARITWKAHEFEKQAAKFYIPKMLAIFRAAGAKWGFVAPEPEVPVSRHITGTLRFGNDPRTSVCNSVGRFHDIGNLYNSDGALFPTSSGMNPTMTICALASYVGASMVSPGAPERAIAPVVE